MKSKFIDLSHTFRAGMPGFRMKDSDGNIIQYSVKINPFLTHTESKKFYKGQTTFEITEVSFQTSIGTYLDSPYHRYPDQRDISQIKLEEVILQGIVVNSQGLNPHQEYNMSDFSKNIDDNIKGKAVLFNFNWSQYWGTDRYYTYPFISEELIDYLIEEKVVLAGVDTINIDDSRNLFRPAHSRLLKENILIVENLTNLGMLINKKFRFYAVPLKAERAAAFPIRAFAELLDF